MIQLAVVRASSVGGEGVAMTLYHDSVGWVKCSDVCGIFEGKRLVNSHS